MSEHPPTDVEGRLLDLRRATDGRVRPSADVLVRIEASIGSRPGRRWPTALGAVAAVAAAIVGIAVLPERAEDQRVTSRPLTRDEYAAAMSERCDVYVQATAPVQVLFPTPEAYAAVAENRLAAVGTALAGLREVGPPPDAAGLFERLTSELGAARASAQAALDAARAGDTAASAAALTEAEAATGRAGEAAAAYGAAGCRPAEAP
ncbi:MAG TPA: hypothetical protein VF244_02735 [Acidimicrobiales bacterium]